MAGDQIVSGRERTALGAPRTVLGGDRRVLPGDRTVLWPEPGEDFVLTPYIEGLRRRALACLEAGYPVHLSGPAGTGKTTLALHLADRLGRPTVFVFGDEGFGSSDLIGDNQGVVSRRVVDNFIHSVLKTEETVRSQWVDRRLTRACEAGYTLIYDEFSRSHAEANNVLLPVLEQRVLPLPEARLGRQYLRVHPEFRAIFTSNPDEFAGVYTPQSALLDRMVTIRLDRPDRDTEVEITRTKGGVGKPEAGLIVDIVRRVTEGLDVERRPSLRASIMIARIARVRGGRPRSDDDVFREACVDVLVRADRAGGPRPTRSEVLEAIDTVLPCGAPPVGGNGRPGGPDGAGEAEPEKGGG